MPAVRWSPALVAGLGALAAALVLHGPARTHLWLHMTQHVVLVAVAAPLLGLALADRPPHHPARALVVATVAHSAAMWVWHLPGPFDAALGTEAVHGIEHLCLFGTAIAFWWASLALVRQGLPGAAIGAVFVVAIQGTALGAVMALSSRPWYTGYQLSDQQLAGVVMWCPAGFVYTAVVAAMLYAWLADKDRVAA
jgi:cytochrome c oxidase assembly factor CtaG